MSTYTNRSRVLTCDTCGDVVLSGWRSLEAHTANHARADQLTARAARVKAMAETRCDSTGLGTILAAETDRLSGHKAAPITSRGLTAKTLRES